jgi:hypothetical protein
MEERQSTLIQRKKQFACIGGAIPQNIICALIPSTPLMNGPKTITTVFEREENKK